ncbi:hypothetical protein SAMN05216389_14010 [Oceanobacillus limi]|uniref:Uncharacterized protein n=1 Tax=Oceanobacillus limi TaxID=930131 RepID=A0A1I0HLV5_9BACI|nr:hypothetical protein [Oceanobacillus limi]SET85022.1 hypothetical protein SAMN05216389_14010 [Oceanobacillus limi]
MCNCDDSVVVGNYKNQIEVDTPKHMKGMGSIGWYTFRETLCIDACLLGEIQDLWNKGIATTGCCCGHNQIQGYIGVIDEHIPRMKELGYKVQFNPMRPNDEDSFIPKRL